ncbi:MAG: crossover junction endodeoxyribonuclease RuvC [Coriobacteriales bacterium]|jgi:crossover junction endodeoxyribonuclease RuvC|nr:crossover junction endodeoxyribonuclease RuvC [Coriobacteriales bacterium]
MSNDLIILGVDPGLANCGWGIVALTGTKPRALAYGCITTTAKTAEPERLAAIYDGLVAVIGTYRPLELSIETVYHKGNTKSSIATAQARGAALVAAQTRQLLVAEYAPAAIKKAVVGNGSADKAQVQFMVKAVLGLDELPSPDHAADALAAAVCHAHLRKSRSHEKEYIIA